MCMRRPAMSRSRPCCSISPASRIPTHPTARNIASSMHSQIAARYYHSMKFIAVLLAGLALAAPAQAIVGGGVPSAQGVGRSVVTIVGSRGNFCTGALIAPKLVLTVAHCVQPGATYKIVEVGADQKPMLRDVRTVAIHPGFNMQAMLDHRATADVALLQLEAAPQGKVPAVLGVPQIPIV